MNSSRRPACSPLSRFFAACHRQAFPLGILAMAAGCARNVPLESVRSTSSTLHAGAADTPEARNRTNFPQTMRLLDEADARLLRGEALEAIVLAKQARDTFATEDRESRDEEAGRRVMSRCALVLAESRRVTGGPLEAMLSLSRREARLDPEQCLGPDAVSRCRALANDLHREFPHIVAADPALEFKAHDVMLDGGTSVERMKFVDDAVDIEKMESFALDVVPSSIRRAPDGGVDIRVEGRTTKRADLVAHVPATDADLLMGRRLVVKLFVDRKQWKRAGNVWNAGVVRVMDVGELESGS